MLTARRKARNGIAHVAAIAALFGLATGESPAYAQPIVLDHAFMVGAWTDDGNCASAAILHRDGRFATDEGREGFWVLDGDRLTMTGAQTLVLRLAPIDRNSVRIVNPDGTIGRSTRCGRDGPAPQAPLPRLDAAYVAGRWTDNGDCAAAVNFTRDGGFIAGGGGEGRWTLNGDNLTMSGSGTLTLRIIAIDPNIMMVINPDGALGRSTRC